MATPKASQGVSTPRNPITSTPNRPTASPRPGTGHLQNRTFAHKSPAVKTPGSSAHGHSHRISISSQPTSTPLAAPAIHDELLNLNSPAAALIASIGTTGLTPLPSGQDGLGITTGITPTPAQDLTIHRSPELERLHRLQQVAQFLESRSLGRGVTRKGVIALAQREKFDQVWDGDTVNIAGVSVDLEIAFAAENEDVIRDVILNLVTDDNGDPQPQVSASKMLKTQLVPDDDDATKERRPWNNLTQFASNLNYLSHHDRLECSTNAFKVVGGLYQTFQKIWAEEKKRIKDRHEAIHICHGNVGKPGMDVGKKLGLSTSYWVNKHELMASTTTEAEFLASAPPMWNASFTLNGGEPSIKADQDWLDSEPLDSSVTTEGVFQDGQPEKPNWKKEESTTGNGDGAVKEEGTDVMDIDNQNSSVPKALGVHFVSHFEPSVLVPINVLTELNNGGQMLQVNQNNVTTLQQALQFEVADHRNNSSEGNVDMRWKKKVLSIDRKGKESTRELAYMLFTSGGGWCYPVSQLSFGHPRQFADAIPILRQYALLWSVLRTTMVGDPAEVDAVTLQEKPANSIKSHGLVTKRSNKKPAQVQLEHLLSGRREADQATNIDVSLDLVSEATQAKLDVLIPVHQHSFLQVKIVIHRNGSLDVVSLTGLSSIPEDKLKRQATRVLRLSEDLGVLIQWLLGQVQTPT